MTYASPFPGAGENPHFDGHGLPKSPGCYEFRRHDGRLVYYTLDYAPGEAGDGENPPALIVVRASHLQDWPIPAKAWTLLRGQWVRYLGPVPEDPITGSFPL
jgi:hypothetical protein